MIISGDVGNFVRNIHVPVDARDQSGSRTATTDVYQQAPLAQRVLFVIAVTVENFQLGAKKLFRPVTLFAGFRSRPEVVYRSGNGPGILVESH